VIASLIYLATQIRQSREQMERNERTTRAPVYLQFWGYLNETSSRPASSPDHAEAIRLGLEDFGQLSDNDAYRFDTWALGMVHALENAHYQHRVGMLDADRWSKHHADLRGSRPKARLCPVVELGGCEFEPRVRRPGGGDPRRGGREH
jgi:hypothetical protein